MIVVQHNGADLTNKLIRSIAYPNYTYNNLRIRIVDNGSSHDLAQPSVFGIDGTFWYWLPENIGYTRAVNYGLTKIRPTVKYVLLVNNDVEMSNGAIKHLVDHLDSSPTVGAVSARHQTASPSPEVLSFACVMLRREAINQVGPLDESFEYGVDDDYSIRLKAAGWQLAVADVHVHHEGAATWKAVKGDDWIKQDSEEALRRLAAKHG